MAKTDRDTQKVLSEGEELTNMTHSRGWGIARDLLTSKIMDLQNIHNLPDEGASIENVVVDIKARKAAVGILFDWLRQIEGTVQQHEANQDMLTDTEDPNQFIERGRQE